MMMSAAKKLAALASVVLLVQSPVPVSGFLPLQQQARRAATDNTSLFGLLGRFRKQRSVEQKSPPKPGDRLPDIDVELLQVSEGEVEAEPVSLLEVVGDVRTVLVGMPGAFTPTCTKVHVPGYIENQDKLQKLGIDKIAVLTTNDRFVNEEWSQQTGLLEYGNDVVVLCDADGDVVKEMGLAEDMGFGVGVRSKRFALVTNENGQVETLLTDEGLNDCNATSAESLIELLTPEGSVGKDSSMDSSSAMIGLAGVAVALLFGANAMSGGGGGVDDDKVVSMAPFPTVQVEAVDRQMTETQPERNGELSLLEMMRETA